MEGSLERLSEIRFCMLCQELYVILKGMESHSMFHYQEDYIPRLTLKIKIKRHCGQRIRKNFRLEVRRW